MQLNIVQLESRRERLRKEITANLDFLIGSVTIRCKMFRALFKSSAAAHDVIYGHPAEASLPS